MCALTKKISSNARFKLAHFNFLHRTYITLVLLNRIDPSKSSACPRCQDPTATFLHLAWQCPAVYSFWQAVANRVSSVARTQCPLDPRVCLLGDIPVKPSRRSVMHTNPKLRIRFIHLLLVLAKRRVAISWMGTRALDIARWERDLGEWAVVEEVRMRKTRRGEKLDEYLEI